MNTTNSDLHRQEIKQSNNGVNSREIYGDKLRKKSSNKIRIVFQNINGLLPEDDENKKEIIREFISTNCVDIFMLAEVNVNWKIVSKQENLRSMTKKWFKDSRVVTAHNMLNNTKKQYQPGGVGMIVTGDLSASVV